MLLLKHSLLHGLLLHGKLLLLLHKDLVWITHYWHLSDHHVLNILILVLVLLSTWALILAITVLVEASVSRLLLLPSRVVLPWLLTTWIHLGHWVELLNDVSIGLGHCWHLHHSLRILVILHI